MSLAPAFAEKSVDASPPRPAKTPARPFLQRRATEAAAPASAPESVHRTLASPGRPLDGGTREFMESRFGHDFSQVRIHTDSQAADSARDVHAHAYTVGNDIAFAPGQYQPHSHTGRELLAHELAHTVQQSSLQRSSASTAVAEGTSEYRRLESEAESAARSVVSGGSPGRLSRASGSVVSRQAKKAATSAPAPVQIQTQVTTLGALSHQVAPDGPLPAPGAGTARVRKFVADPFYLPGSKGEGADKRYADYVAAQQLRAVVGFNDSGQPRTELWQVRDRTEVLGESWLQLVGWPVDEKNTRWQAVTGQSYTFPKVGAKGDSAQIDHIIELQLGGTNNPGNLRPLDAEPNGESGRLIWEEVSKLAKAIKDEPTFAVGANDQIEIKFTSVQVVGPVWEGDYTKPPINALKAHNKAMSGRTDPKDDTTVKYLRLAAGANADDFAVPADWGTKNKTATLDLFAHNKAPSQLISSLRLTALNYVNANGLTADAEVDLRNRTRIPLDTKAAAAAAGNAKFKLTGTKQAKAAAFDLKLPKAPPHVKFDYPYLSPVEITSMSLNSGGDLDWKGTLTPSVKLLGPLGLEFTQGELKVVKGIDKETLKKTKVLGFAVTDADVKLKLAPEFDIEAGFKFQMGSGEPPLVLGEVSLKKDPLGVVGEGNIQLNLPKIKSASSKITYKGGGGRDDWTVQLQVRSDDIKLGAGYSISGQLDAFIEKGELKFAGALDATLPGNNSASLGLRRSKTGWQLFGQGTFKVPKLNQITADATYDLGTEILVVSVGTKTGFRIPVVGLQGNLDKLTLVINRAGSVVVTGKGSLDFERGKAKGHADVELLAGGFFKGDGTVSYKLRDDLTVTGGIHFDETAKPKMRVTGELKLDKLRLFDGVKNDKELLKLSATIPVPGLSAGTSGVVITVGGGLTLGYAFGPGVIAPIVFKAGFNPLEDTPDLELEVTGTLSIPASAYVTASAFAEAGLQVDALIAKGGIAAGLELSGKIELKGEVFADLKAGYKKSKLSAAMIAGLRADLILGLALTAYVRAYAESIIGLGANERWDWVLKQASFPTGLKFELSAPFGYDSETGLTLPTLDDVKFQKPEIDAAALIQKVWNGSAGTKTKS